MAISYTIAFMIVDDSGVRCPKFDITFRSTDNLQIYIVPKQFMTSQSDSPCLAVFENVVYLS